MTSSTFINNTAGGNGGGIDSWGQNSIIYDNTFINNTANHGGGIYQGGNNTNVTSSTFTGNNAITSGGGIRWIGSNGILSESIFTNNTSNAGGNITGGAIIWYVTGSMIDCNFINTKWDTSNEIYIKYNLNIQGGKGIVTIFNEGTLSGISIVVLNNETYYYPPNTNINLIKYR